MQGISCSNFQSRGKIDTEIHTKDEAERVLGFADYSLIEW